MCIISRCVINVTLLCSRCGIMEYVNCFFFCWQLDDCRVGTVQQLWGMKVLIYEKQDSLSDLKNDMCSTSCILLFIQATFNCLT